MDLHDLMAHFLTPASEKIWNSSGSIITEEGEFSLAPTNQEGWDEVIFGAQVLIESTYILNRPDRANGRKDWIEFSKLLEPIGKRALDAAERQNSEELFEIGAAKEKLKGPTGVNHSTPIPIELLNSLPSSKVLSSTPQRLARSRKVTKSTFCALGNN